MINLIPPHARRRVITEYWVRVLAVWLLLLGSALLIIAILNLPVYVLLNNQKDAYLAQSEKAMTLSIDLDATEATINRTNEIARLLAQGESEVPFTEYIVRLEELTNESVVLTDITLTRDTSEAVKEIQLTGLAETRQSLANFRNDIEADQFFDAVELPISNLAKDEDILFSVKITPANPADV